MVMTPVPVMADETDVPAETQTTEETEMEEPEVKEEKTPSESDKKPALEANPTGKVENIKWTYNVKTKTITITGSGKMPDFAYNDDSHWHLYRNKIEKVVIGKGITFIGKSSFRKFTKIKSISIPSSVTEIGEYAFYECKSLRGTIDHECKSLNLSDNDNLCLIESDSFAHCNSLKEVKLPQQLQEGFAYLQPYSFFDCPNLELMKLPKNGVMKAQKAISKCPLIIMEIYEAEICSEDLKGRNELMRDSPLFVRLASHLNALRKAVFPRKKSRKSSPITIPSPNYGLDEINTPTFAI